jgi:hypothetical protein
MLPLGGLHVKHAVQRGILTRTQHLLQDRGKPRKILIELACRRCFRLHDSAFLQSKIQSQSCFMTGGLPPINLSWRQVPLLPTIADIFPTELLR